MDVTTLLCVFGIVAAYLLHHVITEKGDFEAGGRVGPHEFFLKAKEKERKSRLKR